MADYVILVDEHDHEIGIEEKIRAHESDGRLHRAFSIFLINRAGELLLQRRAQAKHHFRGLWANACCSHPLPGEAALRSAARKLDQELGISAPLRDVGQFTYRARDADSGLVEHELDHVLIGTFDGQPTPNPDEVDDVRWQSCDELRRDLEANAARYVPWLAPALRALLSSAAPELAVQKRN